MPVGMPVTALHIPVLTGAHEPLALSLYPGSVVRVNTREKRFSQQFSRIVAQYPLVGWTGILVTEPAIDLAHQVMHVFRYSPEALLALPQGFFRDSAFGQLSFQTPVDTSQFVRAPGNLCFKGGVRFPQLLHQLVECDAERTDFIVGLYFHGSHARASRIGGNLVEMFGDHRQAHCHRIPENDNDGREKQCDPEGQGQRPVTHLPCQGIIDRFQRDGNGVDTRYFTNLLVKTCRSPIPLYQTRGSVSRISMALKAFGPHPLRSKMRQVAFAIDLYLIGNPVDIRISPEVLDHPHLIGICSVQRISGIIR